MSIYQKIHSLQALGQNFLVQSKQAQKQTIPLTKINAKIAIYGGISKISLQHEYTNINETPLQTVFIFHVHPEMVVQSLTILTEQKEIQAKIMKKETAHQKYDDAIASGNAVYKLEYEDNQQQLLKMNIGNIMPGKSLIVKIGIIYQLEVYDKSWFFSLSPTFTPKYYQQKRPKKEYEQQKVQIPSVLAKNLPYRYGVQVDVILNGPITRIVCLFHAVKIQLSQNKCMAKITLQGDTAPDEDFLLFLRSTDINQPQIFLQQSDKYVGEIASFVSFFPDFCPPPTLKGSNEQEKQSIAVDTNKFKVYESEQEEELLEGAGDFIFIIDRSGSMAGKRMKKATQAAKLFLQSLPKNSKFNVVSFGTNFQLMFNKSFDYDQKLLQFALEELDEFDSKMGGTNILSPLINVFNQQKTPGCPLNIFLLTDGTVDNTEDVISLVKRNSQKCRCHTFGIGNDASNRLVIKTAIAGKGTYQFIKDEEQNMNAKVISSLSQAVIPALVDFSVEWPDQSDILMKAKDSIENVNHGEKFMLNAILKEDFRRGNLLIKCIETHKRTKKNFNLDLKKASFIPKGEELFKICAKMRMNSHSLTFKEQEDYSLKYQILAYSTSFLAIQKLKQKNTGELKTKIIPVSISRDFERASNAIYYSGNLNTTYSVERRPVPQPSYSYHQCYQKQFSLDNNFVQNFYNSKSQVLNSGNIQRSSARETQNCNIMQALRRLKSENSESMESCMDSMDDSNEDAMMYSQLMIKDDSSKKKKETKKKEKQRLEKYKKAAFGVQMSKTELGMLIKLQKFDGSWQFNNDLIKLADKAGKIFFSVPDEFFPNIASQDRSKAFAVSVALYILDTFFEKKKKEWKRIAIKGTNVLKEIGIQVREAQQFIFDL